MIDIAAIYKNESVEDVLLYFSPQTPYPGIDRMYVKYNFEVAASRELLFTYEKLIREGRLVENSGELLPVRGPNWKEPKFVTEKRYGIE